MAALSLTRNDIFNLSMAFPSFPSLSPRSSRKVSRVCFSYASSYSEDRNNHEGSRDSKHRHREVPVTEPGDEDVTYEAKEAVERTKERAQEMKMKETKEGTYKAAETAESAKERAKDYAQETKEKAKEGTYKAAETAQRAKEKSEEDVAGSVADKAKERTYKAMETMQHIGEKAKQTMKGAWDAAKETTQKIKETVVGKEDDDDEDGGGG
nr:desiccation-related protein pcc3-06 [Quercus suber]POF27445.1 desiccation-related protein pcc3-06 [Quercus suber]